jgi:UPF0755 protein
MNISKRNVSLAVALALVVIFLIGYSFFIAPPKDFPSGDIVIIAHGMSAPDVVSELAGAHIISHSSVLRFILRISMTSGRIHSGAYRFGSPENVFVVAYRLVVGEYGLPLVRITLIDGMTVDEVAAQVADNLPSISASDFIKVATSSEGYLFPDTYFFPPGTDATTILAAMRANFDSKTAPLSGEISASSHSFSDTIIMASLIEKEARTDTDKKIVAGILWNRLALGMPLQVDADRDTYSHAGLPASPICNPGLASIEAALEPTKTAYLYYLTGKDGLMHYATTFAGHEANLRKYLD